MAPFSRETTEAWHDDETDADAEQHVRKTYSTTYDEAVRVTSMGDGSYDFEYTHSIFGQLASTTQDLDGLSDDVEFTYAHDVLGRRTQVTVEIGTAEDYVSTLSSDNLGRLTVNFDGFARALVLVQESDRVNQRQICLVVAAIAGLMIDKRQLIGIGVSDRRKWKPLTAS